MAKGKTTWKLHVNAQYLWVASSVDAKHRTRSNFSCVKKYNTISGFSPLLQTVIYSDSPSGTLNRPDVATS